MRKIRNGGIEPRFSRLRVRHSTAELLRSTSLWKKTQGGRDEKKDEGIEVWGEVKSNDER